MPERSKLMKLNKGSVRVQVYLLECVYEILWYQYNRPSSGKKVQ